MDNKYIGILTSGGDASGMNAAIRAVHSAFQVCIDHALGGHFLSHIVVHQF